MAIIFSQIVVCHFWRVKHSFSSSTKSQVQAEYWIKIELEMQALLQHVVSTKGCPYQCSALGLPLKCTCCFNRWGSCRTGTWNLHRVILNWMLIKFTDVQWPRQTGHIQTCLHTLISHPTDQRVHLSTQGKFKVVSLSIYFSFIHLSILYWCTCMYTHTHSYICIYAHG